MHTRHDDAHERTRRVHRWLVAGFVTVFVPLACYAGYSVNRFENLATLDDEAAATVRGVAADVSQLKTVMRALTGLHRLLQENDEALPSLAASLREHTPWITAMGRYRQIAPGERVEFERQMEARGLYDFRIRDVDPSSGRASLAPARARAFPIASLEPMTPSNLQLFGADLAAMGSVSNALFGAAATGNDHLMTVPAGWPAGGQFMLFSPVYRGVIAPRDTSERLRQADGGYWIIIDPAAMMAGAERDQRRFDIAIEVLSHADTGGRWQLPDVVRDRLIVPGLYPPHTIEQVWQFGTSKLVVGMSGRYGLLRQNIAATLLLIALPGGLLLLTIAASRHRIGRRLEMERGRRALDTERQNAQRTLDAISDAVITIDARARIRRVNPSGARLLERSAEDLGGARLDAMISLSHVATAHQGTRPFVLLDEIARLPEHDDRRFDLSLPGVDEDAGVQAILSRTGGSGENCEFLVVLRDTSAERRFTRQLEYQATHDALTGCTNRLHFEQQLERLAAQTGPGDPGYALLYMDLDQFKVINDTAGHAAGDRLLVELTGELRALLRQHDILCRLGGDEFGMIIVEASREHAHEVADRIYRAFQSLVFSHEGHAFAVRASLGLVHCRETGGSVEELMAAADIACYAAKENGRNELSEYRASDEAMAQRSSEMNWLPRLQRALDQDEFRLHAQPISPLHPDSAQAGITHYELLLRLQDDDGSEIAPWQIIQAAERYGLMREIDRWVIAHALQQIAGALAAGVNAGFSINLSGQSAADATLIDFIRQQYALHDIDPTRVWFEITETAAISHFATAVALTEQIRVLGSKVALDDFGSGLSSFGYLKNLPVDVLKIDGQFVRELAGNPFDQEMVRAISQIARAMGILTVAEFVEDERTMEVLREIGIDYAQGYHIARPIPFDEALGADSPTASLRRAA